jgi:hypothetical protein
MKLPANLADKLPGSFSLPLPGGISFQPTYIQAAAIVFLLFLLILMLGQLRHRMINWEMSGIMPGIAIGFAIALILEGIVIVGGRTIITEVMGWKNAPKPLANVLDAGRSELVKVLGVTDEIPTITATEPCVLAE